VSGLWHGAAWTFVLWGALHGVYQIVGKLTVKSRNTLIRKLGYTENSKTVVIARRIITFILVDAAWLLFRANSISDAGVLIKRLFVGWNIGIGAAFKNIGLSLETALLIAFSLVILFFLDRMVSYDTLCGKPDALVKNGAFIYSVWAIVIVWCLLLSKDMISTFIYFQF
jgi:D-alanyl-lipoteichoic acid acyltransferase DltB (MBOAT superfamily)